MNGLNWFHLLRRMRRKREGWLGFFAFLFLWVKGAERHCSAKEETSKPRSQGSLSFHLSFSLLLKKRNKSKEKEESWLVWVDWFVVGYGRGHPPMLRNKGSEPNTKPTKTKIVSWVMKWNGKRPNGKERHFFGVGWRQWNGINQRRPKRSAVREQTTPIPSPRLGVESQRRMELGLLFLSLSFFFFLFLGFSSLPFFAAKWGQQRNGERR